MARFPLLLKTWIELSSYFEFTIEYCEDKYRGAKQMYIRSTHPNLKIAFAVFAERLKVILGALIKNQLIEHSSLTYNALEEIKFNML